MAGRWLATELSAAAEEEGIRRCWWRRLPWKVRPRSRKWKYLIHHELEGRPGLHGLHMLPPEL
jgi:hypothetical protein